MALDASEGSPFFDWADFVAVNSLKGPIAFTGPLDDSVLQRTPIGLHEVVTLREDEKGERADVARRSVPVVIEPRAIERIVRDFGPCLFPHPSSAAPGHCVIETPSVALRRWLSDVMLRLRSGAPHFSGALARAQ